MQCPECGAYTCEACFEPMTVFTSGTALVCVACRDRLDEERCRDIEREDAQREAARKTRALRNERARARYHSEAERTRRKVAKHKRLEEKAAREEEDARKLNAIMSGFGVSIW